MHYNIIAGNLFKCHRVPIYFRFKFFFIILTWWLTAVWCFAYGFGWEGGTGNMCESESGSLMLKFLLRFVSKWLRFGLFYHHHYHLYHGLSSAKCLPVWLRTLLRTFHSLFHFAHHSHFANKVDEKWQFLSWINCDIQATKSIFEFVSVEKNSVTITKMNMGVRPKFCGFQIFYSYKGQWMSATCNFRSWLFGEFETVKLDAFSIFCEMEFGTYSTFPGLSTSRDRCLNFRMRRSSYDKRSLNTYNR